MSWMHAKRPFHLAKDTSRCFFFQRNGQVIPKFMKMGYTLLFVLTFTLLSADSINKICGTWPPAIPKIVSIKDILVKPQGCALDASFLQREFYCTCTWQVPQTVASPICLVSSHFVWQEHESSSVYSPEIRPLWHIKLANVRKTYYSVQYFNPIY